MKKKLLIRKLTIVSVIGMLIVATITAAHMFLQSDIESLQEKTMQANQQFETNKRNQIDIEKTIQNSDIATKFYEQYKNSDENDTDMFRKNSLYKVLGEIQNTVHASHLQFQMPPFTEKAVDGIKNIKIISSSVSIEYKALTDVMAYRILKLIPKKLPGIVYYKNFTITKAGDIDSNTLLNISEGEMPELVSGNIEFEWIAVKITPPDQKEENKDAAGGQPNV